MQSYCTLHVENRFCTKSFYVLYHKNMVTKSYKTTFPRAYLVLSLRWNMVRMAESLLWVMFRDDR